LWQGEHLSPAGIACSHTAIFFSQMQIVQQIEAPPRRRSAAQRLFATKGGLILSTEFFAGTVSFLQKSG
jgi:hypothetical protein